MTKKNFTPGQLVRDRNEDDVMLCLGQHNEVYVLCLLGDQKIAVEWFILKELK